MFQDLKLPGAWSHSCALEVLLAVVHQELAKKHWRQDTLGLQLAQLQLGRIVLHREKRLALAETRKPSNQESLVPVMGSRQLHRTAKFAVHLQRGQHCSC